MQVSGSFLLMLISSLFGLGSCVAPSTSEVLLEGSTISKVSIRYLGRKTIDEGRLRAHIQTREGSRYVSNWVDADIKELYGSGMVNDVRVLAEPTPRGVEVIYEVTTRPPMGPSPFVGNTVFSDQRLCLESGVGVGERPDRASLSAAARKIEAYYQRHGYTQAKVTVRENAWGTNKPEDFQFIIEEGPASR